MTTPTLVEVSIAALWHLQELEEAWRLGVLSEHDGKGGTRSNRNAELCRLLKEAIKTETDAS